MTKAMVIVDEALCKGCGICIQICPLQVFSLSKDLSDRGVQIAIPVNQEKCTGCGLCEIYCPDFAITVVRKKSNSP